MAGTTVLQNAAHSVLFSLVDLLLLSWILAGIKDASATQRLERLLSFGNFSCYSLVTIPDLFLISYSY